MEKIAAEKGVQLFLASDVVVADKFAADAAVQVRCLLIVSVTEFVIPLYTVVHINPQNSISLLFESVRYSTSYILHLPITLLLTSPLRDSKYFDAAIRWWISTLFQPDGWVLT